MKRLIYLLLLLTGTLSYGQDIPLYTQKLTNSFIYNPAIAGHTFGSLTYSFNKNYTPVNGSPTTSLISAHTPFGNHKYGVGFNFYNETVSFVKNSYFSGAFAYHINLSKYTVFSMGVSGEFNSIGFDLAKVVGNAEDPLLAERLNRADFSFGVNFQTRYMKVGGAMNRLATNLELTKNSTDILSEYYSFYVMGMLPLRGGVDMLEPTLNIRKLSPLEGNLIYDVGLYYTWDNKLIGGLAYRRGNVLNAVVGLRVAEKATFGYSFNVLAADYGRDVGASHEITLRYDFNEKTYQDRFRTATQNAMAYRRKTMSSSTSKLGGKRASSGKMSKSRQKQIKRASPSRRYQDNSKLPRVKKNKYAKKRRKPNYKNYKPKKQKKYKPSRKTGRRYR